MSKKRLRGMILGLAITMTAPVAAQASDPLFVPWTSVLPSFTYGYDPDSTDICTKGHENCVHSVIKEMDRRFVPLADDCDHNAMFALTYLRTTEEYHRFWHEGRFADPRWLNHYDAVFADYYFRAENAWTKGDVASVPPAWRVAFSAADNKQVTGMGNVFLGMNAHITRDLPFVLADIGLVAPDGSSRKPDHDRVNEFLNRVSNEVFPELARRFDPTIDDSNVPGTNFDDFAVFQLIPGWREAAWRNAERLVNASSDAERALVSASIEEEARLAAETFKLTYRYTLLSSFKARDRDAYCAQHKWDV